MMTLSDASSLMDGGEAIDGAAHSGMNFLNFLFIYWLFIQNNNFRKVFFYEWKFYMTVVQKYLVQCFKKGTF